MYKLSNAHIVVDKSLDVIIVDSYFHELTNDPKIENLTKFFKEEDLNKIYNAFEVVSERKFLARINVHSKKFVIIEVNDYGQDLYELRVFDVLKITEDLTFLSKENKVFANILSNFSLQYFIFDPYQKSFSYFEKQKERIDFNFTQFFKYLESQKIEINDTSMLKEAILSCTSYRVFEAHAGERKVMISFSPLLDEKGKSLIVGSLVFEDMSNKVVYSKDVTEGIDGLTQLKNKTSIESYLTHRVDVYKNDTTVMMIDIDNFKIVNDTYGHKYGDEVIISVANIIQRNVGYYGTVGRVGGDEFLVILNTIDTDEVKKIARGIRTGIQWINAGKDDRMIITCSIGIARYPNNVTNSFNLFKLADKCLYMAKNKGKNRYIFYTFELHGDLLHEGEFTKSDASFVDILSEANFKMIDYCYSPEISAKEVILNLFERGKFDRVSIFVGPEMKRILFYGECEEYTDGTYITGDEYYPLFENKNYLFIGNTASLLTKCKSQALVFTEIVLKSLYQYLFIDENGTILGAISLENLRVPRTFLREEIYMFTLVCRLIQKKLSKEKIF